jgi:hypothetical protein
MGFMALVSHTVSCDKSHALLRHLPCSECGVVADGLGLIPDREGSFCAPCIEKAGYEICHYLAWEVAK